MLTSYLQDTAQSMRSNAYRRFLDLEAQGSDQDEDDENGEGSYTGDGELC
jgi:hypothetical protein